MTLSKRERWWLTALLVALVGLVLDRLLLPEPETTSAAEQTPPAQISMKLPASLALPEPPLPALLAAAAEVTPPDVFDPARLGGADNQPAAAKEAEIAARAQEFARRHTLSATVIGPHPMALVGQRALRPGQELDGFMLESVGPHQAVFVSDGCRVVLRVPAPRQPP